MTFYYFSSLTVAINQSTFEMFNLKAQCGLEIRVGSFKVIENVTIVHGGHDFL